MTRLTDSLSHTQRHKDTHTEGGGGNTHTRARVQYSTSTFKRRVPFNLLSIYFQHVKILYIRLEYEGQSYITCLYIRRSFIILTQCNVFIAVYLTTLTAAQTICHQLVWWIMKYRWCRKKWFWPNKLSRHWPGWTENIHKVLSWNSQALAWIQTLGFQNTNHEWRPPNCNA